MPTTINSIIYSRKSRAMEGLSDSETLEKQRETLLSYADSKGYNVLHVFEEVASSVDEDREQFNAMIDLIKYGKVDVVIVSAIDRLARSLGIFENFIQICKNYNVMIETPQSQLDLSNEGSELLALIQSVLAKSEYGQIKRRLTEGKLSAVQVKKRWIGTTAPFGYLYDRNKKELIPDEETKLIYRKMVEFALDGISFAEIGRRLNDGGYNTIKGKPWNAIRVQKILKNRTYLGEAEYNSVTLNKRSHATGCHEPLITENEYNRIVKYAAERNNFTDRSRVGKEKTILDGLVYCGTCKRKRAIYITGETVRRKRKTKFYMIRACHHQNLDGSKCIDGGCKSSHVEEIIIDYLKKYQKKLIKQYKDISNSKSDNATDLLNFKLENLEKELTKNEDSTKRINSAYVVGGMDLDEFTKWKNDLTKAKMILLNDIEEVKNQIELLDLSAITSNLEVKIDLIDTMLNDDSISIREVNDIIKTIIKRIEISKPKGVVGKPSKVRIETFDVI